MLETVNEIWTCCRVIVSSRNRYCGIMFPESRLERVEAEDFLFSDSLDPVENLVKKESRVERAFMRCLICFFHSVREKNLKNEGQCLVLIKSLVNKVDIYHVG